MINSIVDNKGKELISVETKGAFENDFKEEARYFTFMENEVANKGLFIDSIKIDFAENSNLNDIANLFNGDILKSRILKQTIRLK